MAAAVWSQVAQAVLVLVLVGAWVLGEGARRGGQRTEQLAAQAASAVADERVRIAPSITQRLIERFSQHHQTAAAESPQLTELTPRERRC